MIHNEEIKVRLEKKNISKAEISRRLNFKSVKTLDSRLIRGDWKFDEIFKISRILKCDIAVLIDWQAVGYYEYTGEIEREEGSDERMGTDDGQRSE